MHYFSQVRRAKFYSKSVLVINTLLTRDSVNLDCIFEHAPTTCIAKYREHANYTSGTTY
jgi:hypothetical protein